MWYNFLNRKSEIEHLTLVKMSVDTSDDSNLDNILTEVGGFGLFQIVAYILVCIPNILAATYEVNYMITANTLDYRWAENHIRFNSSVKCVKNRYE